MDGFFCSAWKEAFGGWSLLLPPPDDNHASGVCRSQQALVTVEADIQHWTTVTLQLVDYGLSVAFHIEEVDTGILTASHWDTEWRKGVERKRKIGKRDERENTCENQSVITKVPSKLHAG